MVAKVHFGPNKNALTSEMMNGFWLYIKYKQIQMFALMAQS